MKLASIAAGALIAAGLIPTAPAQEVEESQVLSRRPLIVALAGDDANPGAGVMATPAEAKTEKVAFLGVVATSVPMAVREQVELKRGVGLVVGSVEKDGPAERAGLKQYDILVKLNDQWLVNPQQFGTLVRMHAPGDEVKLTVMRKGQELTLDAKLVEKEVPVFTWRDDQNLEFAAGGNWPGGVLKFSGVPEIDFQRALNVGDESVTSIGITDSEHTANLTIQDGHKTLTIKKKDGTVVFDGPVDTAEQRATLSPELRAKLERLESRPTMIRMKLRPQVGGATTQPTEP